jgi:hypothetical protein
MFFLIMAAIVSNIDEMLHACTECANAEEQMDG